ncbi:MAG: molecular chaperone TorD family protein [Nitrospinota bacterium]
MSPLFRRRPTPGELAEEAELRRQLYRVQAAAFLEPPGADLLAFLAESYPFLLPGGPPRGEEGLQALRADFTSLFHLSAPPYEAALLDESGHLNARATDRVTDFYRACGFRPVRRAGLVGLDHLSAELEFMAHLAEGEREAWRAGDGAKAGEALGLEARFLDGHLLRWMPVFTAAVEEEAETGLYRALARWTREFALADRAHIEKLRRRARR